MKLLTLLIATIISIVPGISQNLQKLTSYAYNWDSLQTGKTNSGERLQIFERYTNTLSYFEVHVSTLKPGSAPHGRKNAGNGPCEDVALRWE